MDPRALNLRHLAACAAIARLGGVGAAAAATHLTQPAVTQALAKLERQLGTVLFVRHAGGMAATPAATLLVPRIEAALAHVGGRRVTMAQLAALVALARGGSYVSASAATGLAPPSLHRAVGDLALALGRPLVERRGRGLVLTAVGKRIARSFRLALAELAAGLAEVAALAGRGVGRLAIGAMPLARAQLLPATVTAFRGLHPEVSIVIAEGSHAELIEPLRDGELDLLIGALRDPAPGPDVVQDPTVRRPSAHCRPRRPSPRRRDADAGALAAFDWIVPGRGTPLREMWARMFSSAGIALPRVPVECGSVITIRGLLLDSDCLTLLSPDQVAVELASGWLTTIGAPPGFVRTIGLTMRRDWQPTAMHRAFIALATTRRRGIRNNLCHGPTCDWSPERGSSMPRRWISPLP